MLLRLRGYRQVAYLRDGLYEWIVRVHEPALAVDATPAEREEFERLAALSRYFGGQPRLDVPRAEMPAGYWTAGADASGSVRRWRRRCSSPRSGGADADARRRSVGVAAGARVRAGSIAPASPTSTTPARRCTRPRSSAATRAVWQAAVRGNPHADSGPSLASTDAIERARALTLRVRRGRPGAVYDVVFTANASGAIRILAEAFPFERNSRLVLTADNHNSVNGLAWPARRARARVTPGAARRPTCARHDPAPALVRRRRPVALRVSGAVEFLGRAASARLGRRGAGARLPRAARRRVVRAVGAARPVGGPGRLRRAVVLQDLRLPDRRRRARRAPRRAGGTAPALLRRRHRGLRVDAAPARRSARRARRGSRTARRASSRWTRWRWPAVDGTARHGCRGLSHRRDDGAAARGAPTAGATTSRCMVRPTLAGRGGTVAFNVRRDGRRRVRTRKWRRPRAARGSPFEAAASATRARRRTRSGSTRPAPAPACAASSAWRASAPAWPGRPVGALRASVGMATNERDIDRLAE